MRFERTTPGLGIRCSILLSYEVSRGATYRAEVHPNKAQLPGRFRLPRVWPILIALLLSYEVSRGATYRPGLPNKAQMPGFQSCGNRVTG